MKTVKIARMSDVSVDEAIVMLQDAVRIHNQSQPKPEFSVGDTVILDNGCLGVVQSTDNDGCVSVMYINEDGQISGPSYGWTLRRYEA